MQNTSNALKILSLLDHTRLAEDDDEQAIIRWCEQSTNIYGTAAAVCVRPEFVKTAAEQLQSSTVRIATVANFPYGRPDPELPKKQIMRAIGDGADEVDIVFPWKNWLDGDHISGSDLVSGCKSRCGNTTLLKVILETNGLNDDDQIYRAGRAAIDAGADFIKSSTGVIGGPPRPSAVLAMMGAISDSGSNCGLKLSGGIQTVNDAELYLRLVENTLGEEWLRPDRLRFGASRLLESLKTTIAADMQIPDEY